ncbi:MAG: cellulase family glycosylhydrolase [Phycisphaerae bacterium]|nr:cellulase family glycosylhydrolase [Phycisphaerae bacterium]
MKHHGIIFGILVLCLTLQAFAELPVPEGTIRFPDKPSFGVIIHNTGNEKALESIGVSWVRLEFPWSGMEKEKRGQYFFTDRDRYVEGYTSKGMNILGLLVWHSYCNALYPEDPKSDADFDTAVEGFAKFAGACARQYKGKVALWEIGNEPECFPVGGVNQPRRYTKLARAVAKAIRQVDDTVAVGAVSAAWMDRDFIERCMKLGLLKDGTIDVVTFHGYHRATLLPESGLAEDVAWLREQVRANAPAGKKVIVVDSERGYEVRPFLSPKSWSSWRNLVYSESEQAAYLARHFLEEIFLGIEISCWYKDMNDDFALFVGNGSRLRPMGHVYRNMTALFDTNPKQMLNRDFQAHLVDLPDNIVDPNSFLKVKSYVRTYVKDEKPDGKKLIVALWNPVEAFDGKILQTRQRIGENYYEAWRAVSEEDHVEVPVQIKLGPVKSESVAQAYVYDLSATDPAKRQTPLKLNFKDDQAVTDTLNIGPMPTVIVLELKP